MKKIIVAILTLCCAGAILAGCGYSDALSNASSDTEATTTVAQEKTETQVNASDYDDTLEGLCSYFADMGYITERPGVKLEELAVTKMDAEIIGADEGVKYSTKYNGKDVIVELYSYTPDKLNDTAKNIIASVKDKGSFSILPDDKGEYLAEVNAYMSDNGKYLMIFTDKSVSEDNPDTTTDNYKHKQNAIEDLKNFHK